jgi:hypothetical protein
MNRPVAVAAASIDAVKAAHATVIQEKNERRGIARFAAGAAGLAGAGFAGAGVEVAVEFSLLINEVSRNYRWTNAGDSRDYADDSRDYDPELKFIQRFQ